MGIRIGRADGGGKFNLIVKIMKAIVCDRCGEMWRDADDCKTAMHFVEIYEGGGTTASCRKGGYDLCGECQRKLFIFLEKSDFNNETD